MQTPVDDNQSTAGSRAPITALVSELLSTRCMQARRTLDVEKQLRVRSSVVLGSVVLGSLAVAGCAYQADSFTYAHEPFKGVYVNVNCLDIAIEHRKRPNWSDVISYEFGNRCDDPVVVDLAAAKVYGRTREGSEMQLFAFDPLREIRLMRLDGRAVGREAIEYPSNRPLARLCIDAASIAHASPPRWICFGDQD